MAAINRGPSRKCPAVPLDSLRARENKYSYEFGSIRGEEQNHAVELARCHWAPASERLWKTCARQRFPVAQSAHLELP